MIQLNPNRRALFSGGFCPLLQNWQVGFILDHDIAGLAQCATINHHVAGNEHPDA